MAKGEVLFDINVGGYDEDMWDDRALIRNWERAYKSSRSVASLPRRTCRTGIPESLLAKYLNLDAQSAAFIGKFGTTDGICLTPMKININFWHINLN